MMKLHDGDGENDDQEKTFNLPEQKKKKKKQKPVQDRMFYSSAILSFLSITGW